MPDHARHDGFDSTRERRERHSGLCGALHPLLDHVECQRLHGHPGEHGSAVEASSVEVVLEWTEGQGEGEESRR